MTQTKSGRVLGLDYGTKRVGVAMCDAHRMVASPFDVLDAAAPDLVARIVQITQDYEIVEVVVGLPTSLSGGEGRSAAGARALADRVAMAVKLPVHLVDERFTSKMAESSMLAAGLRRRARRDKIDKVAASILLQSYIDRPIALDPDE